MRSSNKDRRLANSVNFSIFAHVKLKSRPIRLQNDNFEEQIKKVWKIQFFLSDCNKFNF